MNKMKPNEDVVLDTKMWLKMKLPVHFRSVAVYLKKKMLILVDLFIRIYKTLVNYMHAMRMW